MEIAITKGRTDDAIAITRSDGTQVDTRFPHKGPVPHDAVHFFVERGLGLTHGFWGTVAGGAHPENIAGLAKAAGHASASRAQIPDAMIVELIQAERMVECFEADLWSAGGSDDDFVAVAQAGCGTSHVPLPAIAGDAIGRVRDDLANFAREWTAAPIGHVAILNWQTDSA